MNVSLEPYLHQNIYGLRIPVFYPYYTGNEDDSIPSHDSKFPFRVFLTDAVLKPVFVFLSFFSSFVIITRDYRTLVFGMSNLKGGIQKLPSFNCLCKYQVPTPLSSKYLRITNKSSLVNLSLRVVLIS